MRGYIITAAISAVVATMADILAPEGWRGYIRIAVGFLILSVLLVPIANLKGVELFPESSEYKFNDSALKEEVSRQLTENVSRDIEERLKEEFGAEAEATVELDIDEKNNIKGVRRIKIKTKKKYEGLEERLREVYGCGQIEFSGNY